MADNLPLIPEKGAAVCADVRPVLREVFRELDHLPPLVTDPREKTDRVGEDGDCALPKFDWIDKYSLECKEIWQREGELKKQHAKRLSREPLPNIYKLSAPAPDRPEAGWERERGIIKRKDLVPSVSQNATRDASLWIKNILNSSSSDLESVQVRGSCLRLPVTLPPPDDLTVQSLSIGELGVRPPPPLPPVPEPPPVPENILCVPPQLDFVNFTIGKLHTQGVRLINVSKFEVRLSIRPPSRRELDVELCGSRGLTVTCGAAAELRVHFRPRHVRMLRDVLTVRVSSGKSFVVPIACYMQPPLLHILVPSVTSPVLSCTPADAGTCEGITRGSDVLELGARLLGDVHCTRIYLHCSSNHAAFFFLTEDAWVSFQLDSLTNRGSVVAGPFVVWPAWWAGGGAVRGCAWCHAGAAGLHTAPLRVLSSTAVVRPLHLLADALYFRPEHLSVEAQEKNYDICSEDDPACECFVHVGTAFPHRALSVTVQLVNHSPVVYTYYWSVRPWGVCSCWEEETESRGSVGAEDDSDRLCVGAREARSKDKEDNCSNKGESARMLRVEPARGSILPRSSCALHVCVPDVGARLGTQRAVLMLILKDIPKESFPPDYHPMIVSTKEVQSDPIPGVKGWTREVCEVVCAQMEVWWEVAPVRFVLDPPVLPLTHSRRVKSLEVAVRATQLFGCEGIRGTWGMPTQAPISLCSRLTPAQSCPVTLHLSLPDLPNEYPETDLITLAAAGDEWVAQCSVSRRCATRHPALRPARAWLGLVPPGAHLNTTLELVNDTHQHICWWCDAWRWWGENAPSAACAGRAACAECRERACSCALLRPARGALPRARTADITYDVNAPEKDGCVATLVRVRRTCAAAARVPGGAGSEARAALVAYRVLAPRLVLRALPCHGDKHAECEGCWLDEGEGRGAGGTAALRPRRALELARRTCYRLRFTNLTPLPTTVHWEPPLEGEDILRVIFIPNNFNIRSYGEMEIKVVLEARKVCGRRIFVRRARVARAHRPVYLLVDTAVAGLELVFEVPLGGAVKTDSFVSMRRSQREEYPWDVDAKTSTPEEMFAEEDRKRAVRAENICRCDYELEYIPPARRPRAPPARPDHGPAIEIVREPPPMTRVCRCFACTEPALPELLEPYSLQFRKLPMRTVRSRTIAVRNESVLTARWSSAVRRWPRRHHRSLEPDRWAGDVCASGVAVQCTPSAGVLGARARVDLVVQVYADCWGLYRDQVLIKVDKVEPIVLDVWIEAVGAPLQFALSPQAGDVSPTLWMSSSDPERVLRVKNTSRSHLTIHPYILTDIEHPQDLLPFRVYLRLFDVPPRTCPCVSAFDSDAGAAADSSECNSTSLAEEVDTGVELYLAPDYGTQDETFFQVSPEEMSLTGGARADWRVTLVAPPHSELAPPANLIFRALPVDVAGDGWYRPEPAAQLVQLRQTVREGRLKASPRELHVWLCALDLPYGDVMRVRKRFRVQNIGNGPLEADVRVKTPWCVLMEEMGQQACGAGCGCAGAGGGGRRVYHAPLSLKPRSSMEMCVEVCISTQEAWPAPADTPCQPLVYPQWQKTCTPLMFYDSDNVLLSVPLILELEYPILHVKPSLIDFGFVTDGDTRKTYFTVSHSSRNVTLDLTTEWVGGQEFQLWPPCLRLRPGTSDRVYIQYTARWCGAPAEGCARVSVGAAGAGAEGAGAGAWCRGVVCARAAPARDSACRAPRHDHTDDRNLLPPDLPFLKY